MNIKEAILNGQTLEQIGNALGVTKQRIHQLCKEQGIDIKALREEREKPIVEAIRLLANQGYAMGEIANELHMTYCQIKRRCTRSGIKCKIKQGVKKL